MDVYDELEALLQKVKRHDCVVIMGDFNSRLPRMYQDSLADGIFTQRATQAERGC